MWRIIVNSATIFPPAIMHAHIAHVLAVPMFSRPTCKKVIGDIVSDIGSSGSAFRALALHSFAFAQIIFPSGRGTFLQVQPLRAR